MILYFLLGIIFIVVGYPLLEDLTSIAQALTQYVVYKYAFKIYKIKKQMGVGEDVQVQDQTDHPIGFRIKAIGHQIQSQQEQ